MKAPKTLAELAREERRAMEAPTKHEPPKIAYVTEGQRQLCALKASGAAIAKRLGVSKPMVTYWRQGKKVPEPPRRKLFEQHFGVDAAAWELAPRAPVGADDVPEELDALPAGWDLATLDRVLQRIERRITEPTLASTELERLARTFHTLVLLRTRVRGDARSDQQKLVDSAAWQDLSEQLRLALEPFPEALKAVTERLEQLGGSASPLSLT